MLILYMLGAKVVRCIMFLNVFGYVYT
jgi:hypothetical protein